MKNNFVLKRMFMFLAIPILLLSIIGLFPFFQSFIINLGSSYLGRQLDSTWWMPRLRIFSSMIIFLSTNSIFSISYWLPKTTLFNIFLSITQILFCQQNKLNSFLFSSENKNNKKFKLLTLTVELFFKFLGRIGGDVTYYTYEIERDIIGAF